MPVMEDLKEYVMKVEFMLRLILYKTIYTILHLPTS